MKKLTFRVMLDNLRSSVAGVADAVTGANKFDIDPDENVKAQDFAFSEVWLFSLSSFVMTMCSRVMLFFSSLPLLRGLTFFHVIICYDHVLPLYVIFFLLAPSTRAVTDNHPPSSRMLLLWFRLVIPSRDACFVVCCSFIIAIIIFTRS